MKITIILVVSLITLTSGASIPQVRGGIAAKTVLATHSAAKNAELDDSTALTIPALIRRTRETTNTPESDIPCKIIDRLIDLVTCAEESLERLKAIDCNKTSPEDTRVAVETATAGVIGSCHDLLINLQNISTCSALFPNPTANVSKENAELFQCLLNTKQDDSARCLDLIRAKITELSCEFNTVIKVLPTIFKDLLTVGKGIIKGINQSCKRSSKVSASAGLPEFRKIPIMEGPGVPIAVELLVEEQGQPGRPPVDNVSDNVSDNDDSSTDVEDGALPNENSSGAPEPPSQDEGQDVKEPISTVHDFGPHPDDEQPDDAEDTEDMGGPGAASPPASQPESADAYANGQADYGPLVPHPDPYNPANLPDQQSLRGMIPMIPMIPMISRAFDDDTNDSPEPIVAYGPNVPEAEDLDFPQQEDSEEFPKVEDSSKEAETVVVGSEQSAGSTKAAEAEGTEELHQVSSPVIFSDTNTPHAHPPPDGGFNPDAPEDVDYEDDSVEDGYADDGPIKPAARMEAPSKTPHGKSPSILEGSRHGTHLVGGTSHHTGSTADGSKKDPKDCSCMLNHMKQLKKELGKLEKEVDNALARATNGGALCNRNDRVGGHEQGGGDGEADRFGGYDLGAKYNELRRLVRRR